MKVLKEPYKCPICDELTCFGIDCNECKHKECLDTVECKCSTKAIISTIINLKDQLINKEIEIIRLTKNNNYLSNKILSYKTTMDRLLNDSSPTGPIGGFIRTCIERSKL